MNKNDELSGGGKTDNSSFFILRELLRIHFSLFSTCIKDDTIIVNNFEEIFS